jgi:hypothetical protein
VHLETVARIEFRGKWPHAIKGFVGCNHAHSSR